MDGFLETLWLIWIAAAIVFALLEVLSLDFFFAMLVGGALAGAVAAGTDQSFTVQVITFAVASTLLLLTLRPWLKRWSGRSAPFTPTNAQALVGQRAEALTEVTVRGGTVKLVGETWSARTRHPDQVAIPESPVEVVEIDGATAVVRPLPAGPGPATGPGSPHHIS